MLLSQRIFPWANPDRMFSAFFSPSSVGAALGSWADVPRLANAARGEADLARRVELFRQLQDLILTRHHAWVPLVRLDESYATASAVACPRSAALRSDYADLSFKQARRSAKPGNAGSR